MPSRYRENFEHLFVFLNTFYVRMHVVIAYRGYFSREVHLEYRGQPL